MLDSGKNSLKLGMDQGLPTALIIGIDNFVAIKLAQELINKDIKVTGVGDFVAELGLGNNFNWAAEVSEVEGNFDYIFDFWGDLRIYKNEKISGEKISLITVDNSELLNKLKKELTEVELNWRIVGSFGVYGVGMGRDTFLAEILETAVKNKNLEVPLSEQKIKLLEVSDFVEAILRASFLSNTEKKSFLILGKTITPENLARILIDKAKMTKMKVFQKEMDIFEDQDNKSEDSEKKLRWSPKVDFEKGIEETLQYFFSTIDEENRNQSKKVQNKPIIESKKVIEEPKTKLIVEKEIVEEKIIDEKKENKQKKYKISQ